MGWRYGLTGCGMTEPAVQRDLVHTRDVSCASYRRSDGLWDIEGRLTDARAEPLKTALLDLAPGAPMHALELIMVIDLDLAIHDLRPRFEAAATTECHQIGGNYRKLIGTRIASGFSRQLRDAVGQEAGCTHMTTLLQAMATAAVQALWHDRPETRDKMPEWLVGSCHGYRAAGRAVALMGPEFADRSEGEG